MAIHQRRQRQGRIYHWVCGVLVAVFVGIFAYQRWINRERQEEDAAELERASKAKLREDLPKELDWPQWRGPRRDGIASGEGLLATWPTEGPPLLWKVQGGGGYSAPAISHGRLVTLVQRDNDETVVCWDAETGKELWARGYPCRFTQDGVGPRATPTISGDRVYTVGAEGKLLCLDLKDGKPYWSKELSEVGGKTPRWGFSFSPLVEGELLIVVPGGPNAVVALDRNTGDVKWNADHEGHPGYSSPMICEGGGKRQVLVFLGKELISVDPSSGRVNWKFPWETYSEVNAATPIIARVANSEDAYVFISSGYSKGCALLRVTPGANGEPTVKQVYKNNLMKNHFGTCVLYRDHLYGFDETSLTCIPFLAGRPKAWYERSFKGRGTVLLAGDQLIVLDEMGKLALVEPTPEKYVEKASFRVTDTLTWTMPVLAQKRLYVRDEQWLYCYDLRAK